MSFHAKPNELAKLELSGEKASLDQTSYKARALSPKFPGPLKFAMLGSRPQWCRPTNPKCGECYMNDLCPRANNPVQGRARLEQAETKNQWMLSRSTKPLLWDGEDRKHLVVWKRKRLFVHFIPINVPEFEPRAGTILARK